MSSFAVPDNGYLVGDAPSGRTFETMVIGDRAYRIHNVVVYKFKMGDVEDPDLYAAEPLWQWQQSEVGKWVMEKAIETPMWNRVTDPYNYGYQYAVTAKLKDVDYTFWTLKWASTVDSKVKS
jgi:hypothetical protein